MCLYTNQKVAKVAEQDIVCYKILYKGNNSYQTPFQFTLVPSKCFIRGELYTPAEEGEAKPNPHGCETWQSTYLVEEGFIHTCKDIDYGMSFLKWFKGRQPSPSMEDNCRIYRCIIPKGTEYFEGHDGDGESYASKAIKFIKEVDIEQDVFND